ncbi:TonB-dependent siderophore receptor [Hansschlegelia zhihuaiae]|uniref:TonB-dependent siderophore receptor n=1 Tax=Hansschlegelia zhihuaiae TaxID=405005 RepID=A0A4Q0MIE9_9HYPH|nr:TonB-dependent siderophore receptor [Hansschlegelia zhihuaiae]RXF73145.1 TonB-dependent siderophore receptor [Hansschlegelia zhihuaiae]
MAFRLDLALCATVSAATLISLQSAAAQQAGATQLEELSVEGQGAGGQAGGGAGTGAPGVATNDGYVAKTTRTGTKTDTPVIETPAAINTVTQQQLQDRQPQNLQEALAYTPGVKVGAFGFDPRYDSFFIRGVDVTYTGVFRDGLRQFNSPNGLFRLEPYGLESISILKGPASAIYGASSSAGIVDLISKRPTDYKFGEVEAQTGSFNRMQGNFDIGGPINDEGTVLWRLTGVARNSGTELDAVKDNRAFIAPAVTFKPNDDTKFTILGEYMDSTTGGSAAYQNRYAPDDVLQSNPLGADKTPLAYKDFNDFRQKQWRAGYELEHRFNEFVTLHQNVRYSGLSTRQEYNGSYNMDTGLIRADVDGFAADTYLTTKVETGPARHTILTGVDASYLAYKERQAFGSFTDPHDISTPDYDDLTSFPRYYNQKQTLVGVYAQDEVALDRWRLTFGGRYDWFDSDLKTRITSLEDRDGDGDFTDYVKTPDRQKQNDGKFTGRAALSYVTPFGLTPFVGYGTSFVPNPGTVIGGSVTKPTVGEQVEAGVKYAHPGTNSLITASVFWLKQKDGVVFAVVDGQNQQTQLDFRNRGFEIDATGTMQNGVTLQASYSYTDTEISEPVSIGGKELTGIPKHAFQLWGGYEAKSGALKGLGLGAGVRYEGSSFGDNTNRSLIKNDPRAFVDAKVSYELDNLSADLKGFRLQVNATNLLDDVKQMCTSNYCYWDKGRQVIASVRYRW